MKNHEEKYTWQKENIEDLPTGKRQRRTGSREPQPNPHWAPASDFPGRCIWRE